MLTPETKLEARSQQRSSLAPFSLHLAPRSAFTLTELMIAIAIFVIVLAMAVPVFRGLTGTRSVAAGTNVLSAALNRVRMEAIGLQQHRGVLFYLDQNTGRIGMVTVTEVPIDPAGTWATATTTVAVDLDTNSDPALLPVGVGLQVVIDGSLAGGVRTGNGYIGYNTALTNTVPMGGLICFDADGRLSTVATAVALSTTAAGNPKTPLGNFLFPTSSPPANYASYQSTQIGFVLFDADPYLSQFGGMVAWQDQYDNPPTVAFYNANEKPKEDWLDANATPFLINRYNGTLLKGE